MQEKSIPCSVLVLTRNAAATLERCLRNLRPFAEVLVHDGNSEDDTVALAKRYGARVLKQYDTDEPGVRVKDFTEIRLKQRADAANDWVLYLDADEFLSDELVREIGAILNNAHEKTIIKFPRLPVVEGRIIRHGAFWPEVMPRVHHRRGGCTLRSGKVIHEKYVYDASFTVITARSPLYVPMDPIADLLQKDDRYIAYEVQRLREQSGGRRPWRRYIQWFLLREPLVMFHVILRIAWDRLHHGCRDALPFRYEWRIVRYHARLFTVVTRLMIIAW